MSHSFDRLPDELKAWPNWVCWRLEDRSGPKPSKVPINPKTGQYAKVNDASTWASFDHAVEASVSFNGIGFVFSKDDPFCGIDLDQDNEFTQYVYNQCLSYTEISPSGNGYHIIVRGHILEGFNNREIGLEIYSQSRYFTMTGNVWRDLPIIDCQEPLNVFYQQYRPSSKKSQPDVTPARVDQLPTVWVGDDEILEKIRNAKNGDLFNRLWEGKWEDIICQDGKQRYPSQSEADYALIDIIAFWSRDFEQIERIFLKSGLGKREKAKRKDYVHGMIKKALADLKHPNPMHDLGNGKYWFDPNIYEPWMPYGNSNTKPSGKLIKSSHEFVDGFLPPDYLIDYVLQRRFIYSLTGPTGAGKTVIALRMAAAIASGQPLGEHDVQHGRVLYFAGENPDDVRLKWIVLCESLGLDPRTFPVHFIDGVYSIPQIEERIRSEIASIGEFILVVIDTSAAYFQGDDENSNTQMKKHAQELRRLTTLPGGPTVLVNCHPVKNYDRENLLPRGGGAFLNELDGNLTALDIGGGICQVHWQGKFRGQDFAPMYFKISSAVCMELRDAKNRLISTVIATPITDEERKDIEQGLKDDAMRVLAALSKNAQTSMADMATEFDWKLTSGNPYKAKVERLIKILKKDGLINEDRTLTEKGQKRLQIFCSSGAPAVSLAVSQGGQNSDLF